MDEIPKPNGMRKTTAAAFGTLALIAAVPQLKMLKEFFMGEQIVTNERIERTMNDSFKRLESKLDRHLEDDVVTHRRMHDLWTAEVHDSMLVCEKQSDKVEGRVSNLERYAFGHSRSKD